MVNTNGKMNKTPAPGRSSGKGETARRPGAGGRSGGNHAAAGGKVGHAGANAVGRNGKGSGGDAAKVRWPSTGRQDGGRRAAGGKAGPVDAAAACRHTQGIEAATGRVGARVASQLAKSSSARGRTGAGGPTGERAEGRPASGAGKLNAATATARSVALDVLTRVDQQGAYSNLLLHQTLLKSGLSRPDAGLATELVYGTIQRLNTLDYYLGRFVRGGLAKLEPWVRSLLRLSCYQLVYLERVPDHAVVSEAVNLAKRRGHAGIAGLVNGTLRTLIRERASLAVPAGLPPAEALALRQSHPAWLVARWIERFGPDAAERICAENNAAPHASVRANARRTSREQLLHALQQQGIDAAPSALAPQGLVLRGVGGSAASLPQFAAGELSVQDESSMLVAELLAPQPGMTVLDCCAAPGGKTAHIAEKMGDEGAVWASDVHEHKRRLIDEQAERLGLRSISTMTADARELAERFPPASFDRILLDAPCTGFGVIRRKPDLKWAKQPADIAAISELQRDLLERIHSLLKPGGILVYSTCTIEREENEDNVAAFLDRHPEYTLDADSGDVSLPAELMPFTGMVTILPYQFGSDGFFIARMRRRQ